MTKAAQSAAAFIFMAAAPLPFMLGNPQSHPKHPPMLAAVTIAAAVDELPVAPTEADSAAGEPAPVASQNHLLPPATVSLAREKRPAVRSMIVTAYCPCQRCCGPNACGITASGKRVSANAGHFVAADPSIAFGTRVSIPGYNHGKAVPVLDRGGKIRGDHLDVFFADHAAARQWGVRRVNVTVYP